MTLPRPTLALYEPDIPQNTGTILRTCACLDVAAAIIEPAAFPVTDRAFRRAGMDYLDHVAIRRFACFADFEEARRTSGRRLLLLTTHGTTTYDAFAFRPDDIVMVGRESSGVPDHVHAAADARLVIQMKPGLRSLNIAAAAAVVLGEMRRQIGWATAPEETAA